MLDAEDWMEEKTLEEFGLRLGPVICRSGAEQETFKAVYQNYVNELLTVPPVIFEPEIREARWYDSFLNEKWIIALIGLLLASMLAIYLFNKLTESDPGEVVAEILGPTEVREGEDHVFINNSIFPGRDSSTLEWEWRIVDENADKVLLEDSSQWSLSTRILEASGLYYQRRLELTVIDPVSGAIATATHPYSVSCATPPPLSHITEHKKADGTLSYFSVDLDSSALAIAGRTRDDYGYIWSINGEVNSGAVQFQLYPPKELRGTNEISVSAFLPSAVDFCSSSLTLNYTVGGDRVILPIYAYQPVQYEHIAGFRAWWPLTLIALWLGSLFWGWRRWKREIAKREAAAKAAKNREEAPKVVPAPDAAPYGIPWVSQENRLPLEASHLALARAMRHRAGNTGRRELSPLKTLKATIAAGGFPEPRFDVRERAGEYVLLIDEIDGLSHQGRLFKRLAKELTRRDVYAEVFYYQRQLHRCWNEREPHGLPVEELGRRFGGQRLLLIGDGHELLDHHAVGSPALTPHHAEWLRAFPERVILTPNPPVAWGFEEKVLYRHFNVYPADTRGILEAASRLNDGPTEDRRDFDEHEQRQLKGRNENDPTHIRWRRARDLNDYFGSRQDLLLWARALVVHPSPNFDLTVAIGRALEPFGVVVNHDNLLELSRWKALDEGHFRRRLREDLLSYLDRDEELAARAALAEELEKAKPAAGGGFAARELENVLAVQTFALDHANPTAKAAVGELLRAEVLDPDLVTLLEREVELEHRERERQSSKIGVDPFQQFRDNFAQTKQQIEIKTPKEDGPKGWTELKAKVNQAYNGSVNDFIRLLEKDVPYFFPDRARQAQGIILFIKENTLLPTYEKQPVRDLSVFSRVQEQMVELMEDIRNNTTVWESEINTSSYSATQAVDRMVNTKRYPAAITYLKKRGEESQPEEFDRIIERLQEQLEKYNRYSSPPSLEKTSPTKSQTSNFAEGILEGSIRKLAEDIDQLEKERAEQGIFSNIGSSFAGGESISAMQEPPALDEYFADTTPEKEEEDVPEEKVPRPVWWPLLAVSTGLLFFLLFIWLYPKHNTAELYSGPETKNSWFVKERGPDELAVIKHQQAVTSFQAGNIDDGMAMAKEADAAATVKDPTLLVNVMTAVYNYYAERYNDPSLISGAPDTTLYDLIYGESFRSYYSDYEDIVGRNRSLVSEELGQMNNNYYHLLGLLEQDYALFNGTPINYGDPNDDRANHYLVLKDQNYFDTLSYRPNLQTLIGEEKTRIISVEVSELPGKRKGLHVSAKVFLDEAAQEGEFGLVMTLLNNGAIVDQETVIQPAGIGSSWDIEFDYLNDDLLGKMDTVHFTLASSYNDNNPIASELRIPFSYTWPSTIGQTPGIGGQQQTEQSTPPNQQTPIETAEPDGNIGQPGQSIQIQVVDAITNEPLIYASVFINTGGNSQLAGQTDINGEITFQLEGLTLNELRGNASFAGYNDNSFPDPEWWANPRPAGVYNSLLTAIRNGQGLTVGLSENVGGGTLPPVNLYFGPDDHNSKTPSSIDDLAGILDQSAKEIISQPGFYPVDDVISPSITSQWTGQGEKLQNLKKILSQRCQYGDEVTITLKAASPSGVTGSSSVDKGRVNLVQLALRNDPELKECLMSGQFRIVESPTGSVEYPVGSKGVALSTNDYRVQRLNRVDVFVEW